MGIVRKQGIQNTIISYAGSVVGFVNNIVLFPKVFLIEQVGLLNVLVSASVLYAQISGFGVYNVITKFYPEYHVNGKAAFLKLILKWLLVGFAFLTGLFIFFEERIKEGLFQQADLLQEYFYWILPLSFLILFFEVLTSYSRAILASVFPSFLKDFVLRLFMTAVIVLHYFDLVSFRICVGSLALFYLLVTIGLLVFLVIKGALDFHEIAPTKLAYRKIFKFGLFVFFAESSSLLVSTIDTLMLADFNGLKEAGVYTTMIYLTSAFLIPYGAISKIASPIIPRLWKDNRLTEIQRMYKQVSSTSFALSAFLFLLILFNLDLLFMFLPDIFAKGFVVYIGIGLSRLVDVYYGLNAVILANSRKYMVDLIFVSCLIVLTITTNYLFIPKWGMNGAVCASVVSILLVNLARGVYLRRAFGFTLFNSKSYLQIGFFLLTLALSCFVPFDGLWLSFCYKIVVGFFCFILPYYFFDLAPEIKLRADKLVKEVLRNFKK